MFCQVLSVLTRGFFAVWNELNARRKSTDEAERTLKLANDTAAREDNLHIRQWVRSVQTA